MVLNGGPGTTSPPRGSPAGDEPETEWVKHVQVCLDFRGHV